MSVDQFWGWTHLHNPLFAQFPRAFSGLPAPLCKTTFLFCSWIQLQCHIPMFLSMLLCWPWQNIYHIITSGEKNQQTNPGNTMVWTIICLIGQLWPCSTEDQNKPTGRKKKSCISTSASLFEISHNKVNCKLEGNILNHTGCLPNFHRALAANWCRLIKEHRNL